MAAVLATLAEKLTIEKAGPIVEALLQAMKGVVEDEKSRIISERLTPLLDAFGRWWRGKPSESRSPMWSRSFFGRSGESLSPIRLSELGGAVPEALMVARPEDAPDLYREVAEMARQETDPYRLCGLARAFRSATGQATASRTGRRRHGCCPGTEAVARSEERAGS